MKVSVKEGTSSGQLGEFSSIACRLLSIRASRAIAAREVNVLGCAPADAVILTVRNAAGLRYSAADRGGYQLTWASTRARVPPSGPGAIETSSSFWLSRPTGSRFSEYQTHCSATPAGL